MNELRELPWMRAISAVWVPKQLWQPSSSERRERKQQSSLCSIIRRGSQRHWGVRGAPQRYFQLRTRAGTKGRTRAFQVDHDPVLDPRAPQSPSLLGPPQKLEEII